MLLQQNHFPGGGGKGPDWMTVIKALIGVGLIILTYHMVIKKSKTTPYDPPEEKGTEEKQEPKSIHDNFKQKKSTED